MASLPARRFNRCTGNSVVPDRRQVDEESQDGFPSDGESMRDVRMKGFAERADVEEVEAFLANHSSALDSEVLDLIDCVGRVLAEDVTAAVNVPGFRRSAMDGYAIRGEESFGASEYNDLVARRETRDYFAGTISLLETEAGLAYGFSVVTDTSNQEELLTLEETRAVYEELRLTFELEPFGYFPQQRLASEHRACCPWQP